MNVLFVCLGNICRSPTAEAVLRKLTSEQALDVKIDSAGTAAYHIGKSPDARSQAAANMRGINMSGLKARQANVNDFYEFDYIFAMDESNYQDLLALKPSNASAQLVLFLKEYGTLGFNNVPDPYYGGDQGFEEVLDLLEDACEAWINRSYNK
ncbi:low molecular weight protein-tyrosine-phosphatase [Oceaniserpentilla sp. 4NH20-0058]|uniref:low molecular weight protein-tyrosine-phosphatase n=1 Tax=Oceaniserpentilla sp. 4NH20-0058 TaxID=3127660 RepID=UPI003341F57A